MSFTILHETPDWLAVDKPAGVVVVPARDEDPAGSLWRRLEAERGERLWVVHRLDRDTSGVLLFAREAEAHRALSMAFEAAEVRKIYHAFTRGLPPAREGIIRVPLHSARKGHMRPAAPGEDNALPAETAYRVLESWEAPIGSIAFVEARPRTGRQHQVRVHLRAVEAPLLIDPIYGRHARLIAGELGIGLLEPICERLTLHCRQVTLPAVMGGMVVKSPLAADLAQLKKKLEEMEG